MKRRYKVTGPRSVLDAEPGEELEHEFTAEEEADQIAAGRLAIVPVEYEVIGASNVFDAEPGEKFTRALRIDEEAHLVDGGFVEIARKKAAAAAKTSAATAAKEV